MRNRTLVVVLAMLICLALAAAAVSAPARAAAKPAKAAAKSVKAAAKPAASKAFDQDAVLSKFWKSPDSAVVGTVDGASVTKGELVRALWYWNAPQTLGDLLSQKMIEQAAKKAGVSITPAEQKAKELDAVKRMGLKSVEELLKQFRVSGERFTSSIRISALAEKTATKNIKVTDAEYAEWIKARHILIRFPENETDQTKKEAAAKAKIDEVAAKIKAGEDFAKLADQYSEDPGNNGEGGAKKGGDLGWFTKGKMVADFEKTAFELKVGQVSEPVKTFYGYHIIKVEALGKEATPAEKASLKKQILEKKVPMEMQKWFSELQAKAKMDNKLQAPPEKAPKPVMRPQPPPRTAPAPAPAPAPSGGTQTPPPPPAPAN